MIQTEPISSDKAIIDQATLAKHYHNFIPLIPQWVPQWMASQQRWGFHNQEKKPLTPARGENGGELHNGGHTDPERWCRFSTAVNVGRYKVSKGRKIGLSFFLGSGFGGIDLDQVREPKSGALTALAGNVWRMAMQLGAYTEISPSGCGFKVYGLLNRVFRGDRTSIKVSYGIVEGQFDEQGKPLESYSAYESWNDRRHFCVTGLPMGEPGSDRPVDITPILDLIESDPIIQPIVNQIQSAPIVEALGTSTEEMALCQEITALAAQVPNQNESITTWFNRLDPSGIGTWLLRSLGWQLHSEESNKSHWTRPGKSVSKGNSGTLYHDVGTFEVFTTSDRLEKGTHSLFNIYKTIFFAGDGRTAGRTLGDWMRAGCPGSVPTIPFQTPPRQPPLANVPSQQQVQPVAMPGDGFELLDLDQYGKIQGSLRWIWPGWIASKVSHLISADPGAGKTTALIELICSIFSGTELPDGAYPPKELVGKKVLWIDSDQRIGQQGIEIVKNCGIEGQPIQVVAFRNQGFLSPVVSWDEHPGLLETLDRAILSGEYWGIVIDTVAGYAGDCDLGKPGDLNKFIRPLQALAIRRDIPIIYLGHSSATGGAYGRHIRAKCQICWLIADNQLEIDRSYGMPPAPLRFDFEHGKPLSWKAGEIIDRSARNKPWEKKQPSKRPLDQAEQSVEDLAKTLPDAKPAKVAARDWIVKMLYDRAEAMGRETIFSELDKQRFRKINSIKAFKFLLEESDCPIQFFKHKQRGILYYHRDHQEKIVSPRDPNEPT